jgi:hypothetical protein
MPQISKGDTFADTQQLTAARLNQLVDSATLAVGAISEQTLITTPKSLIASDETIVNDGGALRKVTMLDLLGSDIPVVTSEIDAGDKKDIKVDVYNADPVLGSSYTSSNGSTVVVTTIDPHGLVIGQFVTISGAGSGYNGTFKITAVSSNSFTYILDAEIIDIDGNPVAGSGLCTFTKIGTVNITGNTSVSGRFEVDGKAKFKSDTYVDGAFEAKGLAEFNIEPTIGGKAIPQLYEIFEVAVPPASWGNGNGDAANTWDALWNSATFVKEEDEMWIVETDMKVMCMSASSTNYNIIRPVLWKLETVTTAGSVITMINNWVQKVDGNAFYVANNSGTSNIAFEQFWWKYVIQKGTAFDGNFRISAKQGINAGYTNQTDGFTAISPVSVGTIASQAYFQAEATVSTPNNVNFPWVTVFRIFKYKTL